MSRSQQTFSKRELEKKRAQKKKEKIEKRKEKSESDSVKSGPEIDWSLAPNNKTMSKEQIQQKERNKTNYQDNKEND